MYKFKINLIFQSDSTFFRKDVKKKEEIFNKYFTLLQKKFQKEKYIKKTALKQGGFVEQQKDL